MALRYRHVHLLLMAYPLVLCVGWVEGDFEMTSVYSTRELRPVPKLLVEMVKDPSSLSVIYHGKEGGGERVSQRGEREGAWKGEDPITATDRVCTQGSIVTTPLI